MTDTLQQQLQREFTEEAAGLAPVRFTGRDIVARGRRVQRRRRAMLTMATAAAVAGVVIVPSLPRSARRPGPVPTVAANNLPPMTAASGQRAVALALADGGGTSERHDPAASKGPWSVIVRRTDGSLGLHGAVVTFPVDAPKEAGTVMIDGLGGRADDGVMWWPLGGSWARARGDLTTSELVTIAGVTRVVDGRPSVDAPAGFVAVWSGPYKPAIIRRMRNLATPVGDAVVLGMTFAEAATGAAFEDEYYALGIDVSTAPLTVHGRPAVFSEWHTGNGVLAWETEPGTVVYVGWSGAPVGPEQRAAVLRLAHRAVLLDEAQWQATHPQIHEIG